MEIAQPVALETDVAHDTVLELQVEGDAVAAQRVETLGLTVAVLQLVEVARLLVVVEDHLLVELSQVGH